jgi:hypothetical protein
MDIISINIFVNIIEKTKKTMSHFQLVIDLVTLEMFIIGNWGDPSMSIPG